MTIKEDLESVKGALETKIMDKFPRGVYHAPDRTIQYNFMGLQYVRKLSTTVGHRQGHSG